MKTSKLHEPFITLKSVVKMPEMRKFVDRSIK
jgi:hypothetical protein